MDQKDFFNMLAPHWDETRAHDDEKLRFLVGKLALQAEDRVLDLGSGTGVLLPYLASVCREVVAVDFAEEMLKVAQQKFTGFSNIKYLVADVDDLNLKAESFERITCLNFYPHVPQKEKFVKDMYALLKSGGSFTVMHDISRQAVNGIHGSCEEVQEDRLPPVEKVAALFQEAGFQVVAQEENAEYYFVQGEK